MSKTAVKTEMDVTEVNLKNSLSVIDQIKKKVGHLAISIAANLVKNKEQYDAAVALGIETNQAIKDIKNAAEKETREADAFVKKVKANAKAVVTSLEDPLDGLRERCAEWLKKDNEARAKQVAKLEEKKSKVDEKLVTADTVGDQNKLATQADCLNDKIESVKTDVPQGMVMERRFKIVDASLIPREYLVVDEKALRTAGGGVAQPIRTDIPGIEYYDAPKVAFR